MKFVREKVYPCYESDLILYFSPIFRLKDIFKPQVDFFADLFIFIKKTKKQKK